MTAHDQTTPATPQNARNLPPHRESKPSDIDVVARQYLRHLIRGGGVAKDAFAVEQSNLTKDAPPFEDLHALVAIVAREFSTPPPPPNPETVRYEIEEESQFILTVAPRHVRAFVGFKQRLPLFSWDFRFAQQLSANEAADVSHVLQLFGFEVEKRPVLQTGAASF
jgi:hypothetical protein